MHLLTVNLLAVKYICVTNTVCVHFSAHQQVWHFIGVHRRNRYQYEHCPAEIPRTCDSIENVSTTSSKTDLIPGSVLLKASIWSAEIGSGFPAIEPTIPKDIENRHTILQSFPIENQSKLCNITSWMNRLRQVKNGLFNSSCCSVVLKEVHLSLRLKWSGSNVHDLEPKPKKSQRLYSLQLFSVNILGSEMHSTGLLLGFTPNLSCCCCCC